MANPSLPPPSPELEAFAGGQPDQQPQTQPAPSGGLPAPSPELAEFTNQDVYGTPGQQAIGALESAARAATLGGSTYLERAAGVSPEGIRGREQANPITNFVASIPGAAALTAVTGGVAGPLEEGMLARGAAPLVARAVAHGVEGGIFGAGNAVSDEALGDPSLNAQKILSDIGFGVATSAGLGVLSKGIGAIPAIFRKARLPSMETGPLPETGAPPPGAFPEESAPVADAPEYARPRAVGSASLDDISERVQRAKQSGAALDLPEKGALLDALTRSGDDLEYPPHLLQINSLDSQGARDLYQAAKELPGARGDDVNAFEGLQKQELVQKTDQNIENIAPGHAPIADATQGGEFANDLFKEKYTADKEDLGLAFERIHAIEEQMGESDHTPGLMKAITDAVPEAAQMFDTEAPELTVKPFNGRWGVGQSTYSAIKEFVNSLKEGPQTLEDVTNLRSQFDKHIPTSATSADRLSPGQIGRLKTGVLGYINDTVQNTIPDAEVQQTFKKYAINEQERKVIEQSFGGVLGQDGGVMSSLKPEYIGDKIFSNTATVQAAKQILGKENFAKVLSNYMAELRAKATDPQTRVFSSRTFANLMRRNQDALGRAFEDSPELLHKFQDYSTMMKLTSDAPKINPSGTAKTLLGTLSQASLDKPLEIFAKLREYGMEKLNHRVVTDEINEALAGRASAATKLKKIQSILEKTDKHIDTGVQGIFGKKD